MGLYGVGQSVLREEDPRLLKGRGKYVDDVRIAGEARGFVLRSPHAHAKLGKINAEAAKAAPGVLAVLTGDDLKERGLGAPRPVVPRKKSDGSPAFVTPQPLLAQAYVRYVGEPGVFIVADTLNQAKDAAELIEVEYDPLPSVVTPEASLAPGAPPVFANNPGNEAFYHEAGDKAATDAAFAKAVKIIRHKIVVNRVTTNSMEPRGCLAEFDSEEARYTLRATIQSAHGTRSAIADQIFKIPQSKLRVVCDNMGGGFGMKGGASAEYSLAMWAAEITGRAVKWISERGEGILSDEQARDSVIEAELALDKDAKFLGLRTVHKCAIGAYNTSDRNVNPTMVAIACLNNTYMFEGVHAKVIGALTNTMRIAFYRGGGRPEPLYAVETIVDVAAKELGMDAAEIRRRNAIPPSAMPYTTPFKQKYDCGEFARTMEECMVRYGYGDIEKRRADAKKRGKILGVGLGLLVEPAAGRDYEHVEVRFDPSGNATLICGSMDHGQGHGTTFKQVLSDRLGLDSDNIRYVFGDTDVVTQGVGTFGSRSAVLAGSSVVMAADRIIEKGKKIAAHLLEAADADIVFAKGKFTVGGTDRSVGLMEVAKKSFNQDSMPKGLEAGLYSRADYGGDTATFPNGTHICEVEVDADTGHVDMTRYFAVDDVGVMINPMLCEGQIFGGIVQGAGQALLEDLHYDRENGQLVTGSFMDYCMPRADDYCEFDLHNIVVPTKKNPLGVKGAGEAGTCGALPTVMNAVNDALSQIGAKRIEMPATQERVWRALRSVNA
ncbi:MAG: xanthine dehydrogenase family protein molybdopterin-binding subunit [Burkholderiales bacterium]